MPPSDLLIALRRQPFVPFRLYVSEGATYDIRYPELMMVSVASVMIGVPAEPYAPHQILRYEVVAMRHIIRLVELEHPAAAGGNGQG